MLPEYLRKMTADQRRGWLFEKLVADANGCLNWQGQKQRKGYGYPRFKDGHFAAHRLAWEIIVGVIPDGLWVLHRCDNPSCCNPEHLWLGTHQENQADSAKKGRRALKLTDDDVNSIRAAIITGATHKAVAEKFGVCQSTVTRIARLQRRQYVLS